MFLQLLVIVAAVRWEYGRHEIEIYIIQGFVNYMQIHVTKLAIKWLLSSLSKKNIASVGQLTKV